jgi:hypothetical protein
LKGTTSCKADRTINKLGSQTQTDSLFAMHDQASLTCSLAENNEETVTDSLALQLENKVDDLMIVVDTPEKDQGKSRLFDSTIKLRDRTPTRRLNYSANSTSNNTTTNLRNSSSDFDVLRDEFDFASATKTKQADPIQSSNTRSTRSTAKLASLFEGNDSDVMDVVVEEKHRSPPPVLSKPKDPVVASTTKSKRVFESKMATQFADQFNRDNSVLGSLDKENPAGISKEMLIKKEKIAIDELKSSNNTVQTNTLKPSGIKKEKRLIESSNLNSSCVVYTKYKPPPESIRHVKEVN